MKTKLLVLTIVIFLAAGCGGAQAGSPQAADIQTSAQQTEAVPPVTATATVEIVIPAETSAPAPPLDIQAPPEGQYYHGVFSGREDGQEDFIRESDLADYEAAVGKTAAWVYFSHNWYRGRQFPLETAEWIRDAGSVPYIRMMLWSEIIRYEGDPLFTQQAIIDGQFDADLQAWCQAARDFGSPLLVEYGTEVNGEWFPWNGFYNGAGTTTAYGDPTYPDGPERFRDAYRHIIQVCRDECAENITWVFHVNDGDWPQEDWNAFENYYPGDEWIDWLGLSVYGAQSPIEEWWDDFTTVMDEFYPRLAALTPGKPIIIAEFGSTADSPDVTAEDWAWEALTNILAGRWPRIIGFSWWNENWQNNNRPEDDTTMRVQDVPELAEVFRELVGENPQVLGRLIFK